MYCAFYRNQDDASIRLMFTQRERGDRGRGEDVLTPAEGSWRNREAKGLFHVERRWFYPGSVDGYLRKVRAAHRVLRGAEGGRDGLDSSRT